MRSSLNSGSLTFRYSTNSFVNTFTLFSLTKLYTRSNARRRIEISESCKYSGIFLVNYGSLTFRYSTNSIINIFASVTLTKLLQGILLVMTYKEVSESCMYHGVLKILGQRWSSCTTSMATGLSSWKYHGHMHGFPSALKKKQICEMHQLPI